MSKKAMKQLREVHAIQGQKGCYDIDDYMLGLYNGLELALSLMEQRDVKYKEREALAKQEQGVNWKDMYEKEKRRSAMWIAKYEKDIGPLEYAVPAKQEQGEPVGEIINERGDVDYISYVPPIGANLYTTPRGCNDKG